MKVIIQKDVKDLTYWEVRKEIREAVLDQDEDRIAELKKYFPAIFQNCLNQAKNAFKEH